MSASDSKAPSVHTPSADHQHRTVYDRAFDRDNSVPAQGLHTDIVPAQMPLAPPTPSPAVGQQDSYLLTYRTADRLQQAFPASRQSVGFRQPETPPSLPWVRRPALRNRRDSAVHTEPERRRLHRSWPVPPSAAVPAADRRQRQSAAYTLHTTQRRGECAAVVVAGCTAFSVRCPSTCGRSNTVPCSRMPPCQRTGGRPLPPIVTREFPADQDRFVPEKTPAPVKGGVDCMFPAT